MELVQGLSGFMHTFLENPLIKFKLKQHNTEICYQYMVVKPELQRKNV